MYGLTVIAKSIQLDTNMCPFFVTEWSLSARYNFLLPVSHEHLRRGEQALKKEE